MPVNLGSPVGKTVSLCSVAKTVHLRQQVREERERGRGNR